MARCHVRHIVTRSGIGAIQNALVNLYLKGTTTAVPDAWNAETGGSAVTTLTTNSQGEVECWIDTPKFLDVLITDNSGQAFISGAPTSLQSWVAFTETIEAAPPPAKIVTVDARPVSTAASLQAYINDIAVTGGTVEVGQSNLDAGITVPKHVRLVCIGRLTLPLSFNGVGITLEGHNDGFGEYQVADHILDIQKSDAGWDDGADTTSVGVRLHNCIGTRVYIKHLMNFANGLQIQGDGSVGVGGSQCCTVDIGRILNNKINVAFPSINPGAPGPGQSNSHILRGGQVGHTAGYTSYTGTKGIYIEAASNAHTFIGIDFEGGLVARTLDILGPNCSFVNCRYESATGGWLAAGAIATAFIGGYGLATFPITDSSGGRFMRLDDGVLAAGVGTAGNGVAIGDYPGRNRIMWDAVNSIFTLVAAAGSIAGFRSSNFRDTPGVGVGFYGGGSVAKPTVTGSRGGNAALASLLTALASQGLLTDSST